MSTTEKNNIVDSVKANAKFFELSVTLRIFGHVIFTWTFPPKKD